jgi:hypothetical protein
MIISGKWIFVQDVQYFRVKYLERGKVKTALADGSLSWQIKAAMGGR